jgi:hypothetical protein
MTPLYSLLIDHVCLEVRGRDAGSFLHGQLSQAVERLEPNRAPLAGWHDARGRVRALVRVWRLPDRWLLVTPRDGAEDLERKMRLFVLRAAVSLGVASDVSVAAVLQPDAAWLGARELPADTAAGSITQRGELNWLKVGAGYWQVLGPTAAHTTLAESLPAAPVGAAALAEIALGMPAVTANLAERFVAQTLNLAELGAVAFDKGCYPGQEIIARVQHLGGGVKRRARRYAAAGPPPPIGTPVTTVGNDAAVGEVVRSAAAGSGCELLAVVDNAAAGTALRCGVAPLSELPLPFTVPRA